MVIVVVVPDFDIETVGETPSLPFVPFVPSLPSLPCFCFATLNIFSVVKLPLVTVTFTVPVSVLNPVTVYVSPDAFPYTPLDGVH